MINAIAAKLNVLGDEASITSNLEAIEGKINTLQDKKDQAVVAMAREQSTIQLLDPDGSIQNSNTVTIAELNLAKSLNKTHSFVFTAATLSIAISNPLSSAIFTNSMHEEII